MNVNSAASVLLVTLFFVEQLSQGSAARKLVFVQAIWRHGDRAPQSLPYPNDPYKETAWSRGWSQLTNVYIRSSDSDRALTSAQAFLSGFYPAEGCFKWERGNHWQPIPIHSTTPDEPDLLLKPTSTDCKNLDKLVEEEEAKQAKHYEEVYKDMFKFLGERTGIANFSYENVNDIYDIKREVGGWK
uniref:Lysosomal acid phosphatase n=1 Tax=Angiostrongylus cantonensis TaxID=6313 RepID=A0A0K0DRH1_ANGCA